MKKMLTAFILVLGMIPCAAIAQDEANMDSEHSNFGKPARFTLLVPVNYSDLDSIPKNGKLELGVLLPDDIRKHVDEFIRREKSKKAINPFDPQELDITVFFTRMNEEGNTDTLKAYGFYYQAYRRNGDMKSWGVLKDHVYPEFRVRFTPQETGVWNCEAHIKVNGDQEEFISPPLNFNVVKSRLPGFVKVSEGKRYFEADGELFLPLGVNLPTQGGPLTGFRSEGAFPYEYEGYLSVLKEFRSKGGNYFRYMCTPWTTEIEFEELGNYTDRLAQAWEMDRIVETCEELGLRMHWNMSYMTQLTSPGVFGIYFWDWSDARDSNMTCKALPNWFPNDVGFCYHTDPEFGVETVADFMTNSESVRYYQNRLRYMIARWGYSPNIAVLELFNEVNYSGLEFGLLDNCGLDLSKEYKPYFNDTSFVRKVNDWQIEMGRFIKEDLDHFNQPYCVNYGGAPNYKTPDEYEFDIEDGISLLGNDESYFSEYVDIMSYNDYFRWLEKYQFQHQDLQKLKDFARKKYKNKSIAEKPLMFSEIAMGSHGCDDLLTFRQLFVMSPFTGAAGAGMPWDYNNNMPIYDSVARREKGWSIIPVMSKFFSDVPLNDGIWEPGFDVRRDGKVELLYLTEGQGRAERAVAVINNRTVNRYTMREYWCDERPQDCSCYLSEEDLGFFSDNYETAQTMEWNENRGVGGGQILRISGMEFTSKYTITFYDALNGSFVSEISKWSDAFGRLKLKYPELADAPQREGQGANGSMLLLKVRKHDMDTFSSAEE